MPEVNDQGLTPEADADLDAKLDEIMAGDDDDDVTPAGDEYEPEEAGDGGDPDAALEETETETDGSGAEPTKEADLEYQTARSRLQLTGVPVAVLDRMDRTEITDWWSNRAGPQDKIDQAFRRAAELEKRLETGESTGGGEPAQAEPTLTPELTAAKARLADEFGDEAAEAILAIAGNPTQQPAPNGASGGAVEDFMRESMMAEFGASDPRLRDRTTFAGVEQAAERLGVAGFHSELSGLERIRALLSSAVRLHLPDPPSKADLKRKQKVSHQQDIGSPTRKVASPRKPRTAAQILDAKIAAIQEGASAKDVRARFGG